MLAKLGLHRKDVQWLSGWAFVVLLTLYFFVGGVALFFAPKTAKPALAGVFTSQMKLSQEDYGQFKTWLQSRPPDQPLQIPDTAFKFKLTNGEAAQLDAQKFTDKVSEEVAGRVYEGKLDWLKPEQRRSLGPFLYFNKNVYEPLKNTAGGLGWAAAISGFIMVMFSRRFGRVFSLGLALVAAGLLPLWVGGLAQPVLNNPAGNPPSLVAALKDVNFPISETDLVSRFGDRQINVAEGRTVTLGELLNQCRQDKECRGRKECRHDRFNELRDLTACPLIAEAIQPGSVALANAFKPALEEGEGAPAAAVVFGFLLMLLAGFGRLVHWLSTRGRSAEEATAAPRYGAMAVHQTRALELQLPYDQTFDLCLAALSSVRGAVVKEHDRAVGKVVAKTGLMGRSNGELLEIDVTRVDADKTRVNVSSRPRWSITIFDFTGKNLENVERITAFLSRENGSYDSNEGARSAEAESGAKAPV